MSYTIDDLGNGKLKISTSFFAKARVDIRDGERTVELWIGNDDRPLHDCDSRYFDQTALLELAQALTEVAGKMKDDL